METNIGWQTMVCQPMGIEADYMLIIRQATLADLDFLIRIDRDDEGYTISAPLNWTKEETQNHRDTITNFVVDSNHGAFVYEDSSTSQPIGAILCRFRDRLHEERNETNEFLFRYIGEDWIPPGGRFCEVFNLWIDPHYRRQGLATNLKRYIEKEAARKGIKLIYTHTEERNEHVLALNKSLGYQVIRRGPMWDDVVRVSLIKELTLDTTHPEYPEAN